MRIPRNNTTSFGAKFIKSAQIQKFDTKTGTYASKKVSFVELEPDNFSDVWAVAMAAKYWPDEFYASNIAHCANRIFAKDPKFANKKVYALTKQKDGLHDLNDTEILGLAEVTETNKHSVELEYLQVDPSIIYSYPEKPLKKIGTRILDMLKLVYKDKAITLTSRLGKTSDFYVKNGFQCIEPENNRFIWRG